ncbi:exonuclease SbcCD subunit D C-terminal domain-containing protein [Desulforhopalus sp. 52FAK]
MDLNAMKLLHTSDWHLGRALYGRKRNEEFSGFLTWMIDTLSREKIDVLLIAGDIFDTTTPSNWAQNLYYEFLTMAQQTGCRHIVITAGNHDSATFLEAPAGILKTMNIHVIGAISDNIDREIIAITNDKGDLQLIVCAVPYLRERDIRFTGPGETVEEKSLKLVTGVEEHYTNLIRNAVHLRAAAHTSVPIIAMGHLFAAGGQSVTGDGVRELYVGSLAHVPASIFPQEIDYLALGHLHSSQLVGQRETMRYCGSPLPMSFGEAKTTKKVIIVEYTSRVNQIETLDVPSFQHLEQLSGSLEQLLMELERLKELNKSIWLEIQYTGEEIVPSLQEDLRQAISGSQLEILRIVNTRIIASYLTSEKPQETLEELSVTEVFNRCLDQNEIKAPQSSELLLRFNMAVDLLQQQEID